MDFFTLATALQPDNSVTFTLTVVIAGLGSVMLTLTLLIFVFQLYGKMMTASQNRKTKKALKNAPEKETADSRHFPDISEMPVVEPLPPVEAADGNGIPPEVVAAITAAVYMTEGENAVITSIKPQRRRSPVNVWAQAAVLDNTRPF